MSKINGGINMKLPNKSDLSHKDHELCYRYDISQLHARDKYTGFTFRYNNRINEIVNIVGKYLNGDNCISLEIGCAQADISLLLAERGHITVAYDLNPNFLSYARMKHTYGATYFICGDGNNLPFKRNTFNVIILAEILEHVANPELFIEEAKNILQDDGILIITTPNKDFLSENLESYSSSRAHINDLVSKQHGPDGSHHLFAFTYSELESMLKNLDLEIIEGRYMNTFFTAFAKYLRFLSLNRLFKIENFLSKIPFIIKNMSRGLFFVVKK